MVARDKTCGLDMGQGLHSALAWPEPRGSKDACDPVPAPRASETRKRDQEQTPRDHQGVDVVMETPVVEPEKKD